MCVKFFRQLSFSMASLPGVIRGMPKIVLGVYIFSVLPCPRSVYAQTEALPKQTKTETVLSEIAKLRMPDKFKSELIIDELHTQLMILQEQTNYWVELMSLRTRMRAELDAQTRVRLDEEMRMEEDAVKETGIPTMSRESVELLIRNCLVELQRIDWEVASETVLASAPADKGKNAIVQAKLEGQSAQVVGLEKQLEFAMKNLERLKTLFDKGVAPVGETDAQSAAVEEMKSKLVAAQANMNALRAEMEMQGTESALSSALRLKQLESRKKVILSQLEKLSVHRRLMANVERAAASKDINQQQSEVIVSSIVQSQIQLTESNALLRLLQEALDGGDVKK